MSEVFIDDDEPLDPGVPIDAGAAAIADDSRACPFCGETIKKAAIKCRYCGELLGDPSAPGVFRDGRKVVLSRTAVLPARCVKTNQPAERWLKRQLHWQPPWTYALLILMPIGLLPFLLVALLMQKKAQVTVPLSEAAHRRRRNKLRLAWLIVALSVGAFILAACISNPRNESIVVTLVVVGIFGLLAAAIFGLIAASPVTASRIDDDYIWLRGACPDFGAELPEWLGNR